MPRKKGSKTKPEKKEIEETEEDVSTKKKGRESKRGGVSFNKYDDPERIVTKLDSDFVICSDKGNKVKFFNLDGKEGFVTYSGLITDAVRHFVSAILEDKYYRLRLKGELNSLGTLNNKGIYTEIYVTFHFRENLNSNPMKQFQIKDLEANVVGGELINDEEEGDYNREFTSVVLGKYGVKPKTAAERLKLLTPTREDDYIDNSIKRKYEKGIALFEDEPSMEKRGLPPRGRSAKQLEDFVRQVVNLLNQNKV